MDKEGNELEKAKKICESEIIEEAIINGSKQDEEIGKGERLIEDKDENQIDNIEDTKKEKNPVTAEIISWVKVFTVAIVLALIVNCFLIINASVPSTSMQNTIMKSDKLIGFRQAYLFNDPERGDIVIFKFPDDESQLFVKRIIGMPGETVYITGGVVYIDGKPLEENYLDVETLGDYGPYEVPEDSYFMLGDNRNCSKDSREWKNKYVSRDKIVAKVWFRYSPNFEVIK